MSLSVTASVSQAGFQSISEEVRQLMLDKDATYYLLTAMICLERAHNAALQLSSGCNICFKSPCHILGDIQAFQIMPEIKRRSPSLGHFLKRLSV